MLIIDIVPTSCLTGGLETRERWESMLRDIFQDCIDVDGPDLCGLGLMRMDCQYREKRAMLECPLENGRNHHPEREMIVSKQNTRTQTLTLASASPRRRELMALTGWDMRVVSTEVNEGSHPGEDAHALACRLAQAKARCAAEEVSGQGVLLAADTVVAYEGQLLGKPIDDADAIRMLTALRGREHNVVTALAIVPSGNGDLQTETCTTQVPMREYSTEEMKAYVDSGDAFDKAGGYGIQDRNFQPVALEQMVGCFANVMGLPLCHLVRTTRRMGIEPPNDVPVACQAYTGYTCPVYDAILRDAS
jgi:septum formation protein